MARGHPTMVIVVDSAAAVQKAVHVRFCGGQRKRLRQGTDRVVGVMGAMEVQIAVVGVSLYDGMGASLIWASRSRTSAQG